MLLGCSEANNTRKIEQPENNAEKSKEIILNSISAMIPPISLPQWFKLDTIQQIDSTRNLAIFYSLPNSKYKEIDKMVKTDIESQLFDFVKSLDHEILADKSILNTINSDFQAEPVSIFVDDKIISYLYIVSYYHGGAVHPMTMYYSLNFNKTTKKRLKDSDFWNIKTKADSTFVTNLITESINQKGIVVNDFKKLDYNIEKDSISFNFDDYEIASYAAGIIRGKIAKKKLIDKINLKYR